MASTLGETPPRKKRKRAPDDPFEKNVVVLRNGRDVTRRDDVVLMPNTTIDMSRIKRRENGQFQKITFKCSMTDEEIKTLLQEIFPFLRGQRFYCASAADNRTRLDFHGEPRIWNGAFINSKITGNSALYIFSEENNDHLLNAGMENLHIAETVATTVEDVSDASDDSGFESPGDSCSNMRGDLPTNRSASPPLDVQVFYPINEELNKTFSEYPSADDWVLCEASTVHYDVGQEENYQNATTAESSSTVRHDVEQEETCQGAAAEISSKVDHDVEQEETCQGAAAENSSTVHHDVQQDETCQGAAAENFSTVHHDVTAGATAENLVPEIVPSSDSVKGGKKFHVTLPEKLPDNIQSGTVLFGDNEVPVKKIDSSTFSGFIPAAQQPGWVTVLVFGEANEYLGSTQFLYEDEMEKLISQLAEDPAGWSKLVKLLSQHDVNVLQNTGAQQPGQADVLLACTEANEDEMERVILQFAVDPAEMSKLFRLLSQQFDVKRVDSNAAGTEDEQILKNGQLSCSEESDDSQSDYFADAENSSCISLELDSDWSDTEDMVEPTNSFCIPPELDGNWSDSEDRVEPINSSCSSLELDSDWSDSEDLVEPINSSCSWLELESDWTDSEDRVEASSFILPSHGDTHGAFHAKTRSTPRKRSSWSICRLSVEESGSPVEHYYNTEYSGSFFTELQKAYQEKSSGREEERVKQCSGEYLSQAEGHAAQVHRSNHHVTTDATSHKYKHDLTFINAEQPSNAESVISTPVNNTQKGNTSAENKVGEVTRGDKATQQVEATINDIIHGLTEDCSGIPLETLRAKTLNLLESDDSCFEVLGNVLEYWEYFQQHVAADEIIADVTDKDDLDDLKDKLSQAATKQWPRNDCASSYRRSSSNSPMRRSLPGHNQLQGQHKSLKHQSREFGHETDKEFNVDAMTKGAVQMISDQTNPKATREWPVWSLLPSENKKHERAVNVAIKDVSDRDSTSTVNVSANLFSGEDTLHDSNKISSNVLSLALANSSPRSLVPETDESEEAFTSTASRTYSSHNSNKNFRKACDLFKQNAMQGVTKGGKDHDSTVDTTTKSGFFSAEETFHVEAIQRCLGRTEELSEELHSWFNNPWSVAETFHVGAIQRCLIANRCLKIATCQRVIESEETLTNVFEPWFNNPRSVALHPPKLPKTLQTHMQCLSRIRPYHSQITASGTLLEDRTKFNVDAMTKGAVQMISDQTNPKATREWPVWSLLPSENKKHEGAVNVAIKDVSDRDSTSTVNVSADLFSDEDTLHDSNKISSNVFSLALANSSRRSLVPETDESEEAFTSTASRTYSSHNSNKNFRKACEVNKQNAMQGVTKGGKDHDSTVDTTTKSGFFSAEETFHVVTIVTCQRDIVSEETLTNVFKPWFNNPRSVALHPPELPKTHMQCLSRIRPYHSQIAASGTLLEDRTKVPPASEAYIKGSVSGQRVSIVVIDHARSGKFSLKKSLRGEPFNQDEEGTVGIDVDPSHSKVTTENWKVGEKDQETNSETSISYENLVARAIVENLRQEERVPEPENKSPHAMLSGNSPKRHTVKESASNDVSSVPSAGEFFMNTINLTNHITHSGQRSRQQDQEVSIPKDVETLVPKLLEEDIQEVICLVLDFLGQSVCNTTHSLTTRTICARLEDSYVFKTNLDQVSSESEVLPKKLLAFSVFTHADTPCDNQKDPSTLASGIYGSLQTKLYKITNLSKSGVQSKWNSSLIKHSSFSQPSFCMPQ